MALENRNFSICDVARRAGVSPSTVSRILNNRMGNLRVAEQTRERVLSAARELDYVPNINSRRLVTQRSGVIGILVPSFEKMGRHALDDRHLTRMLSGMESVFESEQYSLMLLFGGPRLEKGHELLTLFRQSSVDGLVVWGASRDESHWDELITSGYPYLFVTNTPNTRLTPNYIGADYETAGYLATRHLLEKGHRRFLWLGGKANISLYRRHTDGIDRAMAEFGVPPENRIDVTGDYQIASAQRAVAEFLPELPFTAVLAGNIWQAEGVIRSLTGAGKRVPQDVAVVGCDCIWDDDELFNPITRIRINDLALGEKIANGILELIAHPEIPMREKFPVRFEAGSTS